MNSNWVLKPSTPSNCRKTFVDFAPCLGLVGLTEIGDHCTVGGEGLPHHLQGIRCVRQIDAKPSQALSELEQARCPHQVFQSSVSRKGKYSGLPRLGRICRTAQKDGHRFRHEGIIVSALQTRAENGHPASNTR